MKPEGHCDFAGSLREIAPAGPEADLTSKTPKRTESADAARTKPAEARLRLWGDLRPSRCHVPSRAWVHAYVTAVATETLGDRPTAVCFPPDVDCMVPSRRWPTPKVSYARAVQGRTKKTTAAGRFKPRMFACIAARRRGQRHLVALRYLAKSIATSTT